MGANYSRYQRDAGGKIKMFTQAPSGFDNESAVNEWLADGTPVFMTARYLHYVCEIPYYPCDPIHPEQTIAERIVRAMGTQSSPRFAMAYGLVAGLHIESTGYRASIFDVITKVQSLLPENVEVVTTDEFVAMARAAAPSRSHGTITDDAVGFVI